jgi:hypothetical protein
LVSGYWSAWQAAQVDVAQRREVERERQQPTEQRVVDKLVNDTQIHRST